MKRSHKIIIGLAAATSVMIAAAVSAHPGGAGQSGMGHDMEGHKMQGRDMKDHGTMGHRADHGMGHGMGEGAMGPGAAGHGSATQLMSAEERTAFQEKMRGAKTLEERRTLAQANRAEMEKRAKEKGITLPQQRGPGAGMEPGHKH